MIFLLVQLEPGPVLDFAEALEREGNPRQAATEFYRFWTYWPNDSLAPYALFKAGIDYAKAGEFSIAIKVFSDYREKGFPKGDHALLEITRIYLLTGDPRADTLLQKLDSVLPRETALMKAWAELTRDDPRSAKTYLFGAGKDSLAGALEEFPKGPTPMLAGCLSILVPGSGQTYYGHYGDALMSFVFSVGMAATSYYYFSAERPVPGWITGGLAGFFWLGQAYGAYVGARARRHEKREQFLLYLKGEFFEDPYTREFFR
ncbi:MAG: tetratricopeptide repeat protein [candidate division WOR-3 bacterium]